MLHTMPTCGRVFLNVRSKAVLIRAVLECEALTEDSSSDKFSTPAPTPAGMDNDVEISGHYHEKRIE